MSFSFRFWLLSGKQVIKALLQHLKAVLRTICASHFYCFTRIGYQPLSSTFRHKKISQFRPEQEN